MYFVYGYTCDIAIHKAHIKKIKTSFPRLNTFQIDRMPLSIKKQFICFDAVFDMISMQVGILNPEQHEIQIESGGASLH